MKTALNRAKHAREHDGGMFERLAEEALLDTPEGLAVRERIDAATCEFYPERVAHVRQVALVVLRAKGVQ